MIDINWSNADRYIWAVSFLLLVLINLFLVVWYRPGSNRNARRLAEKLHNAGEPLKKAVEKNKT